MTAIAVYVPCWNEELTIAKVVRDILRELPEAQVIVVDNDSTDASQSLAEAAGASVLMEKRRGKGYVVQTMFQTAQADVVVMIDGDDTYPVNRIQDLVGPVLRNEADMVVGSRLMPTSQSRFRWINRLGNTFYQRMTNYIFGTRLTDILSGFRAFSGRMVRSLPIFVTGFEVEAELTIKCLERGYRITEVPVTLNPRPQGSRSKIRIVRDGLRILATILALFRDYKPLTFFGGTGLAMILAGGVAVWLAPSGARMLTAIPRDTGSVVGLGAALVGLLLVAVGLILHTMKRRFQELEHYLKLLLNR